MSQFILMLTRADETVPDARALFAEVADTELGFVGFKDVGIELGTMRSLHADIQAAGKQSVLEVVSLDGASELQSARHAVQMGVDYLVGGTRWREVSPILHGTGIKYLPYVGKVVGHPAELEGTAEEIVRDTVQLTGRVDGVNLLAFRHRQLAGAQLLDELTKATDLPVLCAGSVSSPGIVRDVCSAGAWAFTVGTAALDGLFAPGHDLRAQVQAILAETAA
jgi:hypothetical protein